MLCECMLTPPGANLIVLGKAEDPSRANFTVLNQSGVPTHARAMPGRRHAQRLRVTVLRWVCGPGRRPLSPDSGTPRGTERCATAAARLTMAPTVLGQWGGVLHRAMCHSGRAAHSGDPLSSGSGTPRGTELCASVAAQPSTVAHRLSLGSAKL